MEAKNLFVIEFGDGHRQRTSMSFGESLIKPIYVVGIDYNEAAKKAQYYLDSKLEEILSESILDEDGSLNNSDKLSIKIIAVSHVSNIIW